MIDIEAIRSRHDDRGGETVRDIEELISWGVELQAVLKRVMDAIQEAAGCDWRGGNVDTIHYLRSQVREIEMLKARLVEPSDRCAGCGRPVAGASGLKATCDRLIARALSSEEKAYQERDRLQRELVKRLADCSARVLELERFVRVVGSGQYVGESRICQEKAVGVLASMEKI